MIDTFFLELTHFNRNEFENVLFPFIKCISMEWKKKFLVLKRFFFLSLCNVVTSKLAKWLKVTKMRIFDIQNEIEIIKIPEHMYHILFFLCVQRFWPLFNIYIYICVIACQRRKCKCSIQLIIQERLFGWNVMFEIGQHSFYLRMRF